MLNSKFVVRKQKCVMKTVGSAFAIHGHFLPNSPRADWCRVIVRDTGFDIKMWPLSTPRPSLSLFLYYFLFPVHDHCLNSFPSYIWVT